MDTRDNFKRTTLRLPADLYERLEDAAGKAKSVNAVIVETLEEKFPSPQVVADYITSLVMKMDAIFMESRRVAREIQTANSPEAALALSNRFDLLSEEHSRLREEFYRKTGVPKPELTPEQIRTILSKYDDPSPSSDDQ